MSKLNIAIDGPSGAGKSTIAKILANKLQYNYLDTGSMYRAIAYKVNGKNVAMDDEEKIREILKDTVLNVNDGQITLDGKVLNNEIRTNQMSLFASDISKLQIVRDYLVSQQQEIASSKGYILDGRDITTVVLPNAEVKIYLTASMEVRAQRRHRQNIEKNIASDLNKIIEDIEKRDFQDMNRANSPLKKTDDSLLVDTTDLTIDEVVDVIYKQVLKVSK